MESDHIIVASFPDGHSIKSLIEIIHQCIESGYIIYKPDGIHFTTMSLENDIMISFKIRKEDLLEYKSPPYYRTGIHLPTFRALTKTLIKKDKLYLKIIEASGEIQLKPSSKSSISYYKPFSVHNIPEVISVPPPEFIGLESNPLITIPLSEFSKTCLDLSKSEYTEFKIYSSGLQMEGINNSTRDRQVQYGKIIGDYGQVNVHSMNIKALAKLHHLSPTGVIKIYYERSVIKLLIPVGQMGELRIYLFYIDH